MNESHTPLLTGGLSSLREQQRVLKDAGYESNIIAPPGTDVNK